MGFRIKTRSSGGNNMSPGCMALFGLPFFGAGCFVMYLMFFAPLGASFEAGNWLETPCTIDSSGVGGSSDGDTYRIEISYRYEFGGRSYKSDRYDFSTGYSSGYDGKLAVANAYRPGSEAVCYVDPADPREAVLSRGLPGDAWFGLIFGLVFAAVGGGLIVWGIVRMVRGRKTPRGEVVRQEVGRTVYGADTPLREVLPRFTLSRGGVTLKASSSPLLRLIGVMFICLFWNGIVGIFVFKVLEDFAWFLALFLIPFVLVGIGLMFGVLYYFLALFNPRVTIGVDSSTVQIGNMMDLTWVFSGRTNVIRSLRIYLEGREEATYQRGTRTYTDKNVFADVTVAETDDPSQTPAGNATFAVPSDTMHSFEASNNKIIWELGVRGDIRFWPDVNEKFKLTVVPLGFDAGGRP